MKRQKLYALRIPKFLGPQIKSIIFVFLMILQGTAFAKSSENWHALKSPHFKILFQAKNRSIAKQALIEAEKSFQVLSPIFKSMPPKSLIVLEDKSDSPNGLASPFPYPHIKIYATLPDPNSSLGEYENWLYELILHEMTHILTFRPKKGIYKALRFVFGNVIQPSFFLPNWYLEGLAVFIESRYSLGGRLNSLGYKSKLSAYKLLDGGQQENLSRIGQRFIPSYPYGERSYFYGAWIFRGIYKENSNSEFIQSLTNSYSKRLPYFLEGALKEHSKFSYHEHLENTQKSISQIKRTKSLSPGNLIAQLGPKKWFTSRRDKNGNDLIELLSCTQKPCQSKKVYIGKKITRLSLSENKKYLYFSSLTQASADEMFYDIYEYNIAKNKIKTLTSAMRAREPDYSEALDKVVFIKLGSNSTGLELFDKKTQKTTSLIPKQSQARLSQPLFMGSNIIYVSKLNQEHSIWLYNISLSQPQKLLSLPESVFRINRIDKNNFVLIYKKQNKKQASIYQLNRSGIIKLKDLETPLIGYNDLSLLSISDNYYYSEYLADGPHIFSSEVPTPQASSIVIADLNRDFQPPPEQSISISKDSYSPLYYLLPRYWLPFFNYNYYGYPGEFQYGASIGGLDPLRRHSYSASIFSDTLTRKISGGINYNYSRGVPDFSLSAGITHEVLSSNFFRKNQFASTSLSFDLDRFKRYKIYTGFDYYKIESSKKIIRGGPSLGLSYAKLSQDPYDVGISRGWSGYMSSDFYILDTVNSANYISAQAGISTHWSSFLPVGHTLKLSLRAKYNFKSLISEAQGTVTLSTVNRALPSGSSTFSVRGLNTGLLYEDRGYVLSTLEYGFPLLSIYRGWTTPPIFLQRITGRVSFDYGAMEGLRLNPISSSFARTSWGDFYGGAGLDLIFDLQLGHHFPIKLIGSFYVPVQKVAGVADYLTFANFQVPLSF